MPLKLYYAPGACSFVPHSMLEQAGATFEPVPIKLHKGEQYGDDYKALNPRSQVPVLVDGEHVITQILAIITYLNDRFPQMGYLPAEPLARARVMETLAWMNNTVHPTFTHIFMPQKFTDDAAAQQAIKRFAVESYRGLLGEIEALAANAAPWLTGDRPGALDAYALTLLRWGGIAGIDPTGFTATWALAQRFAALPAVATVIDRERLQLNLYQPPAG